MPTQIKTRVAVPSITSRRTMIVPTANPIHRLNGIEPPREDLVLVLDGSPSMDESFNGAKSKLQAAKSAAARLVDERRRLAPQDRIAIVAFWSEAKIVVPLTPAGTGRQLLLDAIHNLPQGDGTDMGAGLVAAGDAMDWHATQINRRIVFLSDGQGGEPIPAATELKSRAVSIDTIGVAPSRSANDLDEPLLQAIASVVDGVPQYVFIKDCESLTKTFVNVATKVGVATAVQPVTPRLPAIVTPLTRVMQVPATRISPVQPA